MEQLSLFENEKIQSVPLQLRNAPTNLMEELHYGEGYEYAHDTQEKIREWKRT